MSLAKLTMIGMEKFLNDQGKSLFDNVSFPEGITKETAVDTILMQGGEFECIYADPFFMRSAIGSWSDKWQRTFLKWVTVLEQEYNPLENYDRKEDWSDTLNKGIKNSARRDSGNTRTFNNQDKRTIDTTNISEDEVSAYDASTYQPAEKTTVDNDGTDTVDYSGTIKDEYGEGTSGQETENSNTIRDGRTHGNIGVTTSQQMLQAELDVQRFNIYNEIADLFLNEFCIMVYD